MKYNSAYEKNMIVNLQIAKKKCGIETRALEILASLNRFLNENKDKFSSAFNAADFSMLYRQTQTLLELLSTTSAPLLMESAESLEKTIDSGLFKIHLAYNQLIEEIDIFQDAYNKLEKNTLKNNKEEDSLIHSFKTTKKILVAENSDYLYQTLRKIITNVDYQINACNCQRSILALCECNHYNLIFIDLDIIELNHGALRDAIKNTPLNSKTPIVTLSTLDTQIENLDDGIHHLKPASIQALNQSLEAYIEDYTT